MKRTLFKVHSWYFFAFFWILFIPGSQLSAQVAISASGGDESGSGGSISFTIGQIFFIPVFATHGYVIPGVQQPYEISVIVGAEDILDIGLFLNAFPNPVTEHLTLEVPEFEQSNFLFYLYDLNGQLVETGKILGLHTYLKMADKPAALYLLKVTRNETVVKTFRIVKN